MKEILGDLFDNHEQFDVIVHGCNCFSTMGAGVAKIIKGKFPYAFIVDKNSKLTPIEKLGKITHTSSSLTKPIIVNAYTQFQWKGKHNVDYDAIRCCMKLIKKEFSGKKLGMPKIGAGLAGGDWNIIKKIIDEELINEDVTVMVK
jgi:O-acetyl-ADP-ribose deacetylase (regulator of RNase III)